MRKFLLFITLTFLVIIQMWSQNLVDVRFAPVKHSHLSCFDLEVRAVDREEILLAGQNYRVFYNPGVLDFRSDMVDSYSPLETYDDIRVLKNHHSEEISTAMVNLGIDAVKFDPSKSIKLRRDDWTKTANVCFERKHQNAFELIWARESKTADLATAYVSLSEWINKKRQQPLQVNEYVDFSSSKNNTYLDTDLLDVKIYPNPVQRELHLNVSDGSLLDGGIINVTNAAGQLMRTELLRDGSPDHSIQVDDLVSGSYYLEIQNADEELLYQGTFIKSSN